jgi:hypothetical protein
MGRRAEGGWKMKPEAVIVLWFVIVGLVSPAVYVLAKQFLPYGIAVAAGASVLVLGNALTFRLWGRRQE